MKRPRESVARTLHLAEYPAYETTQEIVQKLGAFSPAPLIVDKNNCNQLVGGISIVGGRSSTSASSRTGSMEQAYLLFVVFTHRSKVCPVENPSADG